MKKALMTLGAVFICLIVIAIGIYAYVMHGGAELDESSKAFVDVNIPAIISTWSTTALLNKSSPELIKSANEHPGKLDNAFGKFSRLGALQHYYGAKGEATIFFSLVEGKITGAAYEADASFSHGSAKIFVRLIRNHDAWQFQFFNVSTSFVEPNIETP